MLVGVVLLLLQPYPLLHDYPEWMYQGHIAYSLFSGSSEFTTMYELVPLPVPNAISQTAIALLNIVVSPVMAGKIWLAVYLVLALLVVWLGTAGHRQHAAKQLIFLVTIAFGPGFFNGYINFQFGVLLFALFVITDARRSSLWVLVFSLVIYFAHASVFACFVAYVVFSGVLNQRNVAALLALVPSLLMLAWYSTSKILQEPGFNTALTSLKEWVGYKGYTLAKQGPFHNFIMPDGQSLLTDYHAVYLIGFGINLLVAVLIALWLLSVIWMMYSKAEILTRPGFHLAALAATVIVLFILWLLAGTSSFGVVNIGERFLIVALMMLLITVRMPRIIALTWAFLCAAMGVVTILALVSLSQVPGVYTVARSNAETELKSFVDDIYGNSRHKYFNHRLFIYANLGQALHEADPNVAPLPVDHESSIVRMREN